MFINYYLQKDCENVRLHRRRKTNPNKPNSKPIQTQTNPNKPNFQTTAPLGMHVLPDTAQYGFCWSLSKKSFLYLM